MEEIKLLILNNVTLNIIASIIILLVGLALASVVVSKLEHVLTKTKLFSNLEHEITGKEGGTSTSAIKILLKFIYYIFVIFIIGIIMEKLGFSRLVNPILNLLDPIFSYIPNVLGGIVLLIVAIILAKLSQKFSEIFFRKMKVDEKIHSNENGISLSKIFSEIISLVIFILILPGVLAALKLDKILIPITDMLTKFLNYVPSLVAAALVLVVGWFIASKLRDILKGVLDSFKLDEKLSIDGRVLFEGKLSSVIANIVYVLVLIPVFSASLNYLGLDIIISPVISMLNILFNYVPNLVGVALVLVVAMYFGRIIENIITNLLIGLKFDSYLEKAGLKTIENNYSKLVGKFSKILIIYFAIIQSIEILNFGSLQDLSLRLTVLLGDILLGVIVIAIGIVIANYAAKIIKNTSLVNKDQIASIAKIAIIVFVGAMGLRQMGIANEIINLAFGFTVGALAVAFAIAFGIGGKDLAKEKLQKLNCCKKNEEKDDVEPPKED
ncbi:MULTISPECIES: mechanosensitive ion channel [Cetobacterium]|uniref:mechanosensitive ion channel n=1 Tax=Cetobacterium TaxID=180162 RepID=UPI00163C6D92|nr:MULTISPECIES: mechanosensitive ion channel [Cetobacterium]MBC2853568.1 mechanosensitive ion channel [Cetobacterium sp. 2G large]WVJ01851.1 mechanosensitive ion channel [Cetobacterium somerae]